MELSEKHIKDLRKALESNRDQIVNKAIKRRQDLSTTDEHAQKPDEYDIATFLVDHSMEARLHDRERRLLRKVQAALKRMDDGEYGTCEICDDPIGLARLKARPTTTFCLACKEDQEHQESETGRARKRPPKNERTPKRKDTVRTLRDKRQAAYPPEIDVMFSDLSDAD